MQSMRGAAMGNTQKAPNIIYVFADQLRRQSCGWAGDEKAHTPNLDKFAESAADLRQTVSSMPVCCAYRASLFTGKYTSSTGMVINELRMNTNHTCLAHCLTDAGYNTAYIGKWHLYANQLGNHYMPKNSYVPRGPDRLGFDGFWAAYNFHHRYFNRAYYHMESRRKIFYGKNVYEPDVQTDMAIEYIDRAKENSDPFFLVLSYGTPHDPWEKNNVPKRFLDIFDDTDFRLPENYSAGKDPYGDMWSNIVRNPKRLKNWMRIYYAMTSNIDWNMGRLLKALDEKGMADNTIVVFSSDHGEMFGAHGRMKKNIFYEESVRVPFLIRWPGKIQKGMVSDVCFNTVDIMPTLLSLAGVPVPEEVEGMDLSHILLGKDGPEPEFAFLMNTGACATWSNGHEWRALRDKRYTYAVFRGCKEKSLPRKELLFDNINDPLQINNLSGDKEYKDIIEDFRKKLKSKMNSIHDTFPNSTWYRDNWIKKRIIQKTATLNGGSSSSDKQ